ncbi:sulfate permease 2 [Reticulomyxa filosa]|uniref:Sulfate permease 2 n=1 Tax=Reticulomyxa filosa TaxID=46433 RepID=X6NEI9_RETFI|nr:sulfate permease 2 [Reticulomyxa filosa]|eukprot:ETO24745.1 sulfate permease 2 [Reticulomyxa filosa]
MADVSDNGSEIQTFTSDNKDVQHLQSENEQVSKDVLEDTLKELHPNYDLTQPEEADEGLIDHLRKLVVIIGSIVYIKNWVPKYKKSMVRGDIAAGLSVIGMLIPQATGGLFIYKFFGIFQFKIDFPSYSGIVGVSTAMGLYTSCVGLCLYPLFGTSRHITFGCSVLGAVLPSSVLTRFNPLTDKSNTLEEYETAVNTLSFMTGIFFFFFYYQFFVCLFAQMGVCEKKKKKKKGVFYTIMSILGIGNVASFLSYPVLQGFIGGAAIQIAAVQIRSIFALSGTANTTIESLKLLRYLKDANWTSFAFLTLIVVILFTFINFQGKFLYHDKKGSWNKHNHKAPSIIGVVDLKFPTSINIDFDLVKNFPDLFLLQALLIAVVLYTTHVAGLIFFFFSFPSFEFYTKKKCHKKK